MRPFLSIDLETYGIEEEMPKQRYFHPLKSLTFDGVPRDKLIRTVSLTWRQDKGTPLAGAVLDWDSPKDRHYLEWVLAQAVERDWWILGMNLLFDVAYLRYCCPILKGILQLFGPRLVDLIVLNYLAYDVRPEKSLKDLAHLFGITSYPEKHVAFPAKERQAAWTYNQQDTAATLLTAEYLINDIRRDYGSDTDKLSDYAFKWWSELLWSLLHMAENGIQFDIARLRVLHDHNEARATRLDALSQKHYGQPLGGPGSQKAADELFADAALHLGAMNNPRLQRTKERAKVSTGKDNLQLFLELLKVGPHAEPDPDLRYKLRLLARYRTAAKIVSSYTHPILDGVVRREDSGETHLTKKGKKRKVMHDWHDCRSRNIDGLVYPQWYPVPSSTKDDSTDEIGGTKQARLAAKYPAAQTFPKVVARCQCSRFSDGTLLEADLSQIELRVPALLSGDPVMCREYQEGIDRHAATAIRFFGPEIVDHPKFRAVYRQAGKHSNFAVSYGASAKKLQATLLKFTGQSFHVAECEAFIAGERLRYAGLIAWQKALIARAQHQNFIQVPLTGHSRRFDGSPDEVIGTYYNEILNMGIQPVAALILQSAQIEITKGLLIWKSCVVSNTHDSVTIDQHPTERRLVSELLEQHMPNPPYYQDLCALLGRSVPLEYEVKEL